MMWLINTASRLFKDIHTAFESCFRDNYIGTVDCDVLNYTIDKEITNINKW